MKADHQNSATATTTASVPNTAPAMKAAFSVPEFCQAFSIGRTKAYSEIAAGRLAARKIGKKTVILASDAEAWAAALPSLRSALRTAAA